MWESDPILVLAACAGLMCPWSASAQSMSCSNPLYANYELRFNPGGRDHTGRLSMSGCHGTMEVQFVESGTGRSQRVSQRMTARSSPRGILIQGSNPLQAETKTPYPNYSPDTLRFYTRPDGVLTIENCDGQGCMPVQLISRHPPVKLRLHNQCHKQISVAILYKTIDGVWLRRGWWVVAGDAAVLPRDVETLESTIYLYAVADGLKWNGSGTFDFRDRWVIGGAFEIADQDHLSGVGGKTERFFGATVPSSEQTYTYTFEC